MAEARKNLIGVSIQIGTLASMADVDRQALPTIDIVCPTLETYHRLLQTIKSDPDMFNQPALQPGQWLVAGLIVSVRLAKDTP